MIQQAPRDVSLGVLLFFLSFHYSQPKENTLSTLNTRKLPVWKLFPLYRINQAMAKRRWLNDDGVRPLTQQEFKDCLEALSGRHTLPEFIQFLADLSKIRPAVKKVRLKKKIHYIYLNTYASDGTVAKRRKKLISNYRCG
jgi:hypothetical protein